jgi:hypothetical protein
MANEASKIERWIYYALTADLQLAGAIGTRVYQDEAPEDPLNDGEDDAYPLVVFNHQASQATNGMGACRLLVRALYQIKVIARDEHDDASRLVADRIDEVIGHAIRAQHPDDLSFKFSGRLDSLVSYTEPERDSSRWFRHLGGLYWIMASPA